MKFRNIVLLPFCLLELLFVLTSCIGEDRWTEYKPLTAMDEWMDSVMRKNYYWVNKMPSFKKLNYFITPVSFLKSAKCDSDNVSHIDTIADVTDSYGITALFKATDDNDTVYNAIVTYVDTASPAYKAGLKRGDWIMKVGGKEITSSIKSTILSSGEATTLTLGKYTATTVDGTTTYSVEPNGSVLSMEASGNVTDNPVHYHTILTSGTQKIGYLVYSSFKSGTSDAYNNELRSVFSAFKTAGINDLILDLRYNKGGEIGCAQLLAAMLVPSDKIGGTFVSLKYADQNRDSTLILSSSLIGSGANLNLSRLYVITTSATAQMSETLITSLTPYMSVYTIGKNTAGYIGVTESYTNSAYPYIFYPVTSKAYNASDKTYDSFGIEASATANDTSDLATLLDFGNKEETMLSATLAIIK